MQIIISPVGDSFVDHKDYTSEKQEDKQPNSDPEDTLSVKPHTVLLLHASHSETWGLELILKKKNIFIPEGDIQTSPFDLPWGLLVGIS